ICLKHAREEPVPPSQRAGKPVSAGLEAVLMKCLVKDPAGRPGDAAELLRDLDACEIAGTWTAADAAAWWAAQPAGGPKTAATDTSPTPAAQKVETASPSMTMDYRGD